MNCILYGIISLVKSSTLESLGKKIHNRKMLCCINSFGHSFIHSFIPYILLTESTLFNKILLSIILIPPLFSDFPLPFDFCLDYEPPPPPLRQLLLQRKHSNMYRYIQLRQANTKG